MGGSKRLLVDAYGDEISYSGCDACGWTQSKEVVHSGFGGVTFPMETTQCERCTHGTAYDEAEVRGRTWPSSPAEAAESMWTPTLTHLPDSLRQRGIL